MIPGSYRVALIKWHMRTIAFSTQEQLPGYLVFARNFYSTTLSQDIYLLLLRWILWLQSNKHGSSFSNWIQRIVRKVLSRHPVPCKYRVCCDLLFSSQLLTTCICSGFSCSVVGETTFGLWRGCTATYLWYCNSASRARFPNTVKFPNVNYTKHAECTASAVQSILLTGGYASKPPCCTFWGAIHEREAPHSPCGQECAPYLQKPLQLSPSYCHGPS